MTLYWEDFKVGETVEMGRHTFTEEEIIAFARQFDPQPFHVDPQAAARSAFGGLIASGWHTCAICMRL
ncbi:MAG: MaoC/PaaZ C-terminal domain-containing protein, partial [Betaproteobacteria bacterium]|nr:MaoC/PaaZ C-terminal domain-containing protein [Betaproteobacteria bacterium]